MGAFEVFGGGGAKRGLQQPKPRSLDVYWNREGRKGNGREERTTGGWQTGGFIPARLVFLGLSAQQTRNCHPTTNAPRMGPRLSLSAPLFFPACRAAAAALSSVPRALLFARVFPCSAGRFISIRGRCFVGGTAGQCLVKACTWSLAGYRFWPMHGLGHPLALVNGGQCLVNGRPRLGQTLVNAAVALGQSLVLARALLRRHTLGVLLACACWVL